MRLYPTLTDQELFKHMKAYIERTTEDEECYVPVVERPGRGIDRERTLAEPCYEHFTIPGVKRVQRFTLEGVFHVFSLLLACIGLCTLVAREYTLLHHRSIPMAMFEVLWVVAVANLSLALLLAVVTRLKRSRTAADAVSLNRRPLDKPAKQRAPRFSDYCPNCYVRSACRLSGYCHLRSKYHSNPPQQKDVGQGK